MKPTRSSHPFARHYQAQLRRYLGQPPSASLKPATRLGHRAVALGMETLDLALLHEQAMLSLLMSLKTPAAQAHIVARGSVFFAEAIVPLEATHRSARESNINLNHLNAALGQRTADLSSSNRKLQRELAKRRAVERTLRESKDQATRLLSQSRILQGRLRNLSRRILQAQEEERRRISRELHDVIAQVLAGINVRLAVLKTETSANTRGLRRKIAGTQRLVQKSVDLVHRFARELRPTVLDELGLVPALHAYLKRFMQETGVRASLTAFAGLNTLSNAHRTALYRVAQEALANVASHAHATRVDVHLEKRPHALCMRIKDDGRAFNVARVWNSRTGQHLGLLGMKERIEMVGGTFTVLSARGRGTTVEAEIPFGARARRHVQP